MTAYAVTSSPAFHGDALEPCQSLSDAPVQLNTIVWVGAFFGATSACGGALVCRVSNALSGIPAVTAALPVAIAPTLWPLWDDAVVVGLTGLSFSAYLGQALNLSDSLLSLALELREACGGTLLSPQLSACDSSTCRAASFSSGSADALAASFALPCLVVAAVQAVWAERHAVLLAPSVAPPFQLTLTGSTRLLLRGKAGAFASNATTVSLGGVPVSVGAVSSSGEWLLIDTPTPEQLCGSASRDCGYVALEVSNAPEPVALGASLTCPPFCPGVVERRNGSGGGVIPLALGEGGYTLGVDPPTANGSLPTVLPRAEWPPSADGGIYYAAPCDTARAAWTDPSTGACANASDPASYACAYGGGATCVPCPAGALCPGGSRLWPRPGYWVAGETAAAVVPCPPPDPGVKCSGWSPTLGSVQCGAPYLQGSYLCSVCALGFVEQGDGSCKPCPAGDTAATGYARLIAVLVVVGSVALLTAATRRSVVGGCADSLAARRVAGVVARIAWVAAAAQAVAQTATPSAASLPAPVQTFFRGLAILQVRGWVGSTGGASPSDLFALPSSV